VSHNREAFHGPGVQDFRDWFWLTLCLLFLGRKKERETAKGTLFPGLDTTCWLCCAGFSQLLGANKGWLKGQSLNFICT
jgi:hypothetical protein